MHQIVKAEADTAHRWRALAIVVSARFMFAGFAPERSAFEPGWRMG